MSIVTRLPSRHDSDIHPVSPSALRMHLKAGQSAVFVDRVSDQAVMFCAARDVSAAAINDMAGQARGLISLVLSPEKIARLNLPLQPARYRQVEGWSYIASVEARHGITTGISAAERAHTIRTAAAPDARAEDLVSPGHVFPIRVETRGRGARAEGHVYAHLDAILQLVQAAEAGDGAVVCQILSEDGSLMTAPEAQEIAARWNLPIIDEIGCRTSSAP